MYIYRLDYVLDEPEESHGWMYRAEIPALQVAEHAATRQRKHWGN